MPHIVIIAHRKQWPEKITPALVTVPNNLLVECREPARNDNSDPQTVIVWHQEGADQAMLQSLEHELSKHWKTVTVQPFLESLV